MELSRSVIKQFVEVTKDDGKSKNTDNTVYGEIVQVSGGTYVKIDGSSQLTPVSTTARVKVGDRVIVTLKNHTATIIGNTTDPSASGTQVEEVSGNVTRFQTIVTDELNAHVGRFEELEADYATIDELYAKKGDFDVLIADSATFKNLESKYASFEHLEANYATVYELEAKYATIVDLNAINAKVNVLDANYAEIDDLYVKKAEIESLDGKYANIDFSNISKATMEEFYANSGLIKDVVIGNGTITGHLSGVTISGELIEADTIRANSLIAKGEDGLYYKLNVEAGTLVEGVEIPDNRIHGSIIATKSISAEQISVTDLIAFGATIAGFHLSNYSIYSGVKESVDNTTRGIYLDKTGQVAFGDASNYIKYFKDQNGAYKLAIAAESLVFSANNKSVEETIDDAIDDINLGITNLIRNSETLIFEDYYFSGPFVSDHDGNGNVDIICGTTATDDDDGNVAINVSEIVGDDGDGNITIYTPITYVQSTGDGYIDTGVYCAADMELFIRFRTSETDATITTQTIDPSVGQAQGISVSSATGNIELVCGNATVSSAIKYVAGHVYEIRAHIVFGDTMSLQVKDLTIEEEDNVSIGISDTTVPEATIGLFGTEGGTMPPDQQIEAASIKCDGVLVRNYIPVRSGDTVGLYDTVESGFAIATSGSLVAGEDAYM